MEAVFPFLGAPRESKFSSQHPRSILFTDRDQLGVGTGRARSVISYRLGVAIRGHRNLSRSWEAPNRYSNERPALRSIKGEVNI